jgi:adenine-specific DNA-methyltransferase
MQDARLIQGDFALTLRLVADDGGADLILMSPPYADARTYGADVAWTLPDYQRLGDSVKLALKPGGHCLMVLDAPVREWREGFGTERSMLPWKVMIDWAERVGMRIVDRLAYGRMGAPGEYLGRFRNDWEPLLWFQRTGGEPYFDRLAVAERAARPYADGVTANREVDGSKRLRRMTGIAAEQGLRNRGTFWDYTAVRVSPHDELTQHPARYYLPFAEDAVRCFAPPGGLVCDPFVGSGTSAIAAVRHGRRFVGGDLLCRPTDGMPWIEVTRRRLASDGPVAPQAKDHGPLFG